MAKSYCRVLLCLTVAVVLLCIILPSASAGHTETYYVTQYQSQYNCYPYTYTYCYNWYYWNYWYYRWYWSPYYYYSYWNPWYGWGYWPACYYRTSYNCYYTYTSHQVAQTRCVSGWTGTNCDVPVCSPACTGGQVCAEINGVNKCTCTEGNSGSACSLTPCSPAANCYPGTCISGACKCPPGFTGSNCDRITQKPTMGACSVKLSAMIGTVETVIATAECAADVLTPRTTWVGYGLDIAATSYGLANIEFKWASNYEFPLAMPAKPSGNFFVKNVPVQIGIGGAAYSLIVDGRTVGTYNCPGVGTDSPQTSSSCDVPRKWSDLNINSAVLRHNGTFTVKMTAQLGGHKELNPDYGSGYSLTQIFTGDEAAVQASFQFDLEPPSHCLLETGKNCTVFPIFIDQDITTNPVINPKFLEWTDDGSGIYMYHVEVFILGNNGNDRLAKVGNPLGEGDVTGSVNNFQFTAPQPGVYSIELTVYDRANNTARARKIFNFNDQPSFKTTSNPVYVQEADEKSRFSEFSFIKQLDNPRSLNLKWPGRFISDPLYSTVFKMPVEQWSVSGTSIDDQYGQKYGQRSTAAVANLTGIASLRLAFTVDRVGGGIGIDEPANSSWLTTDFKAADSTSLSFDPPLKDGDTVVIWLRAVGVVGDQSNVRIKTLVDTSPVTVTSAKFVKKGVDKYVSTIVVETEDLQSGINSTWYQIRNKRTGTPIYTAYSPAVVRDPPPTGKKKRDLIQTPCLPGDTTCYCTPFRKCFAKQQVIKIDHCVIDIYSSSEYTLEVAYKVSNLAGYESSESLFDLGDISGLQCRNTGLSGGAIAGIVIACIIGFLIIILLVILIITYRRRPEFKERIDRTVRHVRQTVWRHREENPVYTSAPPPYTGPGKMHYNSKDPEGGFSGVENPGFSKGGKSSSSSVIARRQLQMQEVIGEGRFATISRADLTTNDGNLMIVAAKALKNGFSPADEQLMAKKVLFLKKTPPHGNIVRFIGSVDDEGNGEGPIILMELCEYTLKDWLASRRQISTDDLEIMLGFAINIARGVQHLHSCKIYHRRLAVRNVLVQQQANGLVAKLIGFGPTADDSDEVEGGAASGVSVPIKWLAPETLDTLQTSKPTYNDKTDAWSYAITIWEMYSKGTAPYEGVRSSELREQLRQGIRLQRPSDCPPEIYTKVLLLCWNDRPAKRPKFDAIIKVFDEFRRGADDAQGYYTSNDAAQPQDIYDDAH